MTKPLKKIRPAPDRVWKSKGLVVGVLNNKASLPVTNKMRKWKLCPNYTKAELKQQRMKKLAKEVLAGLKIYNHFLVLAKAGKLARMVLR